MATCILDIARVGPPQVIHHAYVLGAFILIYAIWVIAALVVYLPVDEARRGKRRGARRARAPGGGSRVTSDTGAARLRIARRIAVAPPPPWWAARGW